MYLIAGVIYGFVKQKEYASLNKVFREQEENARAAREEYLACEKCYINMVKMRELEEMILGTVSSDKMSSNEYSLLKVNKLASNNSTTETITPSSENKVDCTVNQKSDANISKKNIYYSLITLLIHIYCRKVTKCVLNKF
ncbi:uncharacterized protein LOC143147216 isoform X2 [Ptiloglossa arizonensis]|uniref:uncharacterized protein LOC143147216 isoform X2 n=1 Tax=Ptiloglossa arizonensis TaxID=3350558 RepID=UPI003F9F88F0